MRARVARADPTGRDLCPNEATAKINAIVSGRRGQFLGFDTREGWAGWEW